ncbi:MAG TPA: class I adenylate-forming enzyme family protein [Stellaceae bacterium]|nr:class I adenylate-forming enzyme family protein [Stellaceae bacterium]
MDPLWQNLSDPIFHCAQTRGDAPALIEGPERLTYRALAALVAQATVYLHGLGIGQGDRIGVALTNSIDHVILQYALFRIGATLIELPVEDSPDALAATARQYGIRTIFTEAHVAEPPGIKRIRVDLAWRGQLAGKSGDYRSTAPGDVLQFIALTTGSTGAPSGWAITHRNAFRHNAAHEAWRYPKDEVFRPPAHLLIALPLRLAWTISSVLVHFVTGGPVVLLSESTKAEELLRAALAWGDAILAVTPNVCRHFLLAAPETGLLLPKLRRLEFGGQPLYAEEKRAVVARVCPNFHETYGTTAAGFVASLGGADMMTHPGSVGRAAPGMEIAIVDATGRPLPAGMDGEVRSRPLKAQARCSESGPPPAGGERVVDGWCYTGDIGHLDADGYLYLKGRGTDIIRRGGIELFAPEIEAVLLAYPAVADAAVVGLPVIGQEDQVVAFIVKRADLVYDDLARHCREQLKPGRWPDRVFYLDALPHIPGGKVNRIRLLEIAAEQIEKSP